MPTPKKGARLGNSSMHQKLIFANLVTQLIERRALTAIEAKARVLQPYFEKLVTKAKRGNLHTRRAVAKKITSKEAVYIFFGRIVPELDPERNGGYARPIRISNYKGDNAPLVRIEIVLEKVEKKAVVKVTEATVARVAERAEELTKGETAKVESTETKAPEIE